MPDEDPFVDAPELAYEVQVQIDIFMESVDIFSDRTKVRGHMWREFPPSDKLRMMGEKLRRAEAAYARLQMYEQTYANDEIHSGTLKFFKDEFEDSLLDLNNFSVFAIRQVREGARG